MSKLSKREALLLWFCFGVIFVMANVFAIRFAAKSWSNKDSEIKALENQLADLELWIESEPDAKAKQRWLRKNTPRELSMTKAQGDLLEFLKNDLLERRIKIEKQALQEPDSNDNFQEVGISLRIRGPEKDIIEWLTTLQGAQKFQVIKRLKLELDRKSREEEPQAVCDIILARWFAPIGVDDDEPVVTESPSSTRTQPSTVAN